MWKDILVHVDGSASGRNRLSYSLALTQRFDACLTGIHVNAVCDVPPVFKPSMIKEVTNYLDERALNDARRSKILFRDIAATSPRAICLSLEGDLVGSLVRQARYSDLVVVGQYEKVGPSASHPLTLGSELALRSGRPILVLPHHVSRFVKRPRILLAWDGNLHTVRAVHDGLPLMRIASELTLLMINPEEEGISRKENSASKLIQHLERHGAKVSNRKIVSKPASHSQLIGQYLSSGLFDMVVMGAYTHAPLFEVLFGGVTQRAVVTSPIPLLVSH